MIPAMPSLILAFHVALSLSLPVLCTNVKPDLKSEAKINCESGENKIKSILSSLGDPDPEETMTSVRCTSNDAASRSTNRHLDSSTAKIFPFGDHWHKLELPKARCVSKFIFKSRAASGHDVSAASN